MLEWRVSVWQFCNPSAMLDDLAIAVDSGFAIAWVASYDEICKIPSYDMTGLSCISTRTNSEHIYAGIVAPGIELYRRFLRNVATSDRVSFSKKLDRFFPLVPGDGGTILLKDCLYVPSEKMVRNLMEEFPDHSKIKDQILDICEYVAS